MSLPQIMHTFLDVAVCRWHETFSFKLSLPAMSFEISSVWALCQWPTFRLALGAWAVCLLLCTNGLRKQHGHISGLTFRKMLAGTGWTVFRTNGLKKNAWPCLGSPLEYNGWHWVGCFSPPMHKWAEKTGCLCLGSLLERPWLALGGPFLSSCAQSELRNSTTHTRG